MMWKIERWKIIKWLQYIPVRIKLYKDKQYDGDDEFHHSLNMDLCSMLKMNNEQQEKYINDLCMRRNRAHEKDIERCDTIGRRNK